MKARNFTLLGLAFAAVLALSGCGGGEEAYKIEGPTADHPSVAGTQSSDGAGAAPTMDAKPQKAPPKTKDGR